jgi:hypothetical protein
MTHIKAKEFREISEAWNLSKPFLHKMTRGYTDSSSSITIKTELIQKHDARFCKNYGYEVEINGNESIIRL